ncbi:hypothetical protein ACIBMZ_04390 [Micromonospora sp. NPDC049900]|uniref:hypothetical protein n=1 Tax=Micromonospora sp. NPDC049900 TaxID=3364275 RepID=UPI0037A58294
MSPVDLLGDLQWTFFGPYWTQLSERLAGLSAGEPGPAPDAARPTTARTAITGQEPVEDPSLAIFCQDWRLPVRDVDQVQTYRDRLAEVAPAMKVNLQAWGSTMGCMAGRPRSATRRRRCGGRAYRRCWCSQPVRSGHAARVGPERDGPQGAPPVDPEHRRLSGLTATS